MRLPILCVLLLLPLAGCLGAGNAPLDAATADAAQPAAGSRQPATAARDAAAPAPSSTGEAAGEGQAEVAPVEQSIFWNGKLGTRACVPSGPHSCMSPIGIGGDWYEFLSLDGEPLGASLTLTWASSGPHDETLTLLLLDVEGSEQSWSGTAIASVQGTSPLVLDVGSIPLEAGHSLVVAASPTSVTPSPVYAFVENGTAFQVEGTVTVLPG